MMNYWEVFLGSVSVFYINVKANVNNAASVAIFKGTKWAPNVLGPLYCSYCLPVTSQYKPSKHYHILRSLNMVYANSCCKLLMNEVLLNYACNIQ